MSEEFVTIATYRHAPKAEIVCSLLAQEGIQAFVVDGNTVAMDWFLGNAIGWVKVQVPTAQAEQALEILRLHPKLTDSVQARDSAKSEAGPDKCLACDAIMPGASDRCPSCGWSYDDEEKPASDQATDTDESQAEGKELQQDS